MKGMLYVVTITLLLALVTLPIGYYTFLRILVTLSAGIILVKELNKGITIWFLLFGITAIIFNPILPIYLYKKHLWIPINIMAAILFFSYSFKKQ